MIKTYKRTNEIVKAEQFDGSDEMVYRYNILNLEEPYPRFIFKILGGSFNIKIGTWILTGDNGEHWLTENDRFKDIYTLVEEINYDLNNMTIEEKANNYNILMKKREEAEEFLFNSEAIARELNGIFG